MMMLLSVFKEKYYHNTLENWLISLAIVIGAAIFARLIYWIINFLLKQITSRTQTQIDDLVLQELQRPAILGIILAGLWYALERLHFSKRLDLICERTFTILITINITWMLVRIINALIKNILLPYSNREDTQIDGQMVRLLQQLVKIVLWSIGLVVGLNNAGFDVGALIAGLGIGGLALALASQDTVKNMLGGLIVYTDKPFKIGDRVILDNTLDGHVVEIGIRSTRIITLEGRFVTVPNAYFSEKPIYNVTQGPNLRVANTLGLVYNTPYDKMQEAIFILKDIAKNNIWLDGEGAVFFEQFNSSSLDIKFVYFIKQGAEVFSVRSDINFQILKRFNEAGLEFAYPTQTVYNKGSFLGQ